MPNPGATAAANLGIGFLFTESVKHLKEWKNVRLDCNQLRRDFDMCVAYTEDVILRGDSTHVGRACAKEVLELAHDIEDCLERFMYRITRKDEARWLRRTAHAIWTLPIRNRFAKKLKNLNKRLQKLDAEIRRPREGTTSAPPAAERSFTKEPVCIDQAKQELLTLLDTAGTEPAKLRVISIVGFGGSGKTTLAHAVYQSATAFPLRAWVNRTEYTDACALLKIIIEKLWPEEKDTVAVLSDKMRLQEHLKKLLGNQRYLIVLDDMHKDHWECIENSFQDNIEETSSRIMVTVRTLPTANWCSSSRRNCNGYVYQMRTLGDEASKTIACLTELAHDETQMLRQKCDGLPLALVSVARHFRSSRNRGCPTIQECKELGNKLGSFLHDSNPDPVVAMATRGAEHDPFKDLRDVLMDKYASLDSRALRNSLIYLGIFPDARRLNRNKITGRWVAEGYAPDYHPRDQQRQANEIFELLVDMAIIQRVGISTGRICRAPGIVHEFVRDKSMSENFIRTFDAAEQSRASTRNQRHKRVRHFVVRGSNTICSGAAVNMKDLSHIRSLTVHRVTDNADNLGSVSAGQGSEVDHRSGCKGDGFFRFSKCKVIRVLDLEECTEVNSSHVEKICKLWNLRYLTLGRQVNEVPKEISQLKLLERLHLSKTVVTMLPVDIIRMPSLIHLSGKFMLPVPGAELVEGSKESKLETLSGIVADKRQGFLLLVPQMKNLRKVKICFGQSRDPILDLSDPLLAAITGYLKRELEYSVPRSLCLDFNDLYEPVYGHYPQSLMEGLYRRLSSGRSYYLTSLKLHLQDELVSSMPAFIVLLSGLERLSLSLTSVTQDLLSAISKELKELAHLKLKVDRTDGALVIHEETFQSLESLCLVFQNANCSIPQLHIRGGLPKLRSFQLLCQNLKDLCGIDINKLKNLQEIELHGDVSVAARQQWETAARNHRNRPNVLPFLCVDDPAGAAQVVDRMPATAASSTTSMAVDEPDGVVPVTATINNGLGLMLNAAPVDHEAEIVPVADGAQGGDEPTESLITSPAATSIHPTEVPFAGSSAPVAYDLPEVASATHEDTVVCPDHNMTNMLVPNNSGLKELARSQDRPMDIDEAAPDATIPVPPVRVHAS